MALASTRRIGVGIGIMPAAARNVAFAALDLSFLASAFPGRLMIGVGHGMTGWLRQAGAWPSSPLTLLAEYLDALRALLAGQAVTTSGRYVTLTDVRPAHPPAVAPLVLAGEPAWQAEIAPLPFAAELAAMRDAAGSAAEFTGLAAG